MASGVFRPDVSDPEMSQAGSSLLWELTVYSVREEDGGKRERSRYACIEGGEEGEEKG